LAKKTFASVGYELWQTVNQVEPELKRISDIDAFARPGAQWSKKEIIAHLIDSATNNHQRFVRGVEQKGGVFPSYPQDFLSKIQRSNEAEWSVVLTLWASYNRYLAHILSSLPPEAQEYVCIVGENPPATLLAIAVDYLEHLKHHLNQAVGKRFETTYGAK
jgi:DinB family protein